MSAGFGRTGIWAFLVDGYVASRTRLPNVRRLGGYDQLEEILTERNPD